MKEYVSRGSITSDHSNKGAEIPSGYLIGIQYRRFFKRRLNFLASFNATGTNRLSWSQDRLIASHHSTEANRFS
jgi:hypothetical protein